MTCCESTGDAPAQLYTGEGIEGAESSWGVLGRWFKKKKTHSPKLSGMQL